MRTTVLAALAFGTFATTAFAQDNAAGPANPAIKSPDQNNSSTPVAGQNSFTMSEAKARIEAKGYTGVSGLQKDGNGVWRAMASLNGKTGPVSLDYQGNVN